MTSTVWCGQQMTGFGLSGCGHSTGSIGSQPNLHNGNINKHAEASSKEKSNTQVQASLQPDRYRSPRSTPFPPLAPLPRLGALAVLLPPRLLKKPRPKEERALRLPKPVSSGGAARGEEEGEGDVEWGGWGGRSLIFATSSRALF